MGLLKDTMAIVAPIVDERPNLEFGFQVYEVVGERENILTTTGDEAGIDELTIIGDRIRLTSILSNILHHILANADLTNVKIRVSLSRNARTPEPQRRSTLPAIEIASIDESATIFNDSIAFTIIDTGKALDPVRLERMFDPFHESVDRESAGGSAMGLVLAGYFARLMGGSLHVTSPHQHGKGTSYSFAIPTDISGLDKNCCSSSVVVRIDEMEMKQLGGGGGKGIAEMQDVGGGMGGSTKGNAKESKLTTSSSSRLAAVSERTLRVIVVDDIPLNRKILIRSVHPSPPPMSSELD